MAKVFTIRAFELRGQEYGVDMENARVSGWSGVEGEAVPVGNGAHGTKTKPVVPQLTLPVVTPDLTTLQELQNVVGDSIIIVGDNGVRLLCPSCDFASASEMGADYVTFTYNVGGSPIQL